MEWSYVEDDLSSYIQSPEGLLTATFEIEISRIVIVVAAREKSIVRIAFPTGRRRELT